MSHPSLASVAHRPYPLPRGPWRLAQVWEDLAFLHWPVAASALRPHVPPGLEIEESDGSAWIGVVPFRLRLNCRGLPALPRIQVFPEINVRTYVTAEGRPGVWFFSLDAPSRIANGSARRLYRLAYRHARVSIETEAEGFRFRAERREDPRPAAFDARYRPTGPPAPPAPGTLDHFLTERYCLYAADRRGRLFRGDVHHLPWDLQEAESELTECSMTAPIGVPLEGAPRVAFARRIEVVTWGLTRVRAVDPNSPRTAYPAPGPSSTMEEPPRP